ncbi:hypothetical protein CFAM422_007916 [Trichoderma lentiforme]|uniref:Uncharacterized protein n=1 Tax=Trichoderma lentiforme TaxID=1567552 RepID=A0A9P5CAF6_9HYPO|nr:hypothetical protein CFAM422_007916 [Trichoderma lentiforme]
MNPIVDRETDFIKNEEHIRDFKTPLALIIRRSRGGVVDRRSAQVRSDIVELVQRSLGSTPLEEDVLLEPPGQGDSELVLHESANRHSKDIVELLESALHSLGYPEEDHDERDNVEASVEAECTNGLEFLEQEGE